MHKQSCLLCLGASSSPSMARFSFCMSLVLLVFAMEVHSRLLSLKSEESVLISDGIDNHADNESVILSLDQEDLSTDACVHVYGFLPCAENVGGYVFQVVVFECLLLAGDYLLSEASMQLFSIFGVGIFGGIIFRLLIMIPRIVLLLSSGLSADDEAAQSLVVNGVGLTAGYTVFNLTLHWGACIIFGRTNICDKDSDPSKNTAKAERSTSAQSFYKMSLGTLTDSGVKVDPQTRRGAGIMLLSLIPFILVQLSEVFDSSSWSHYVILITMTVSSLSVVSYFIYQFYNPLDQARSLEFSRSEHLLAKFLEHIAKIAKDKLVTPEGDPNIAVISRVFHTIDKDGNKNISKHEFEELLQEMNPKKLLVEKDYAVEEFLRIFDSDGNGEITQEEFLKGVEIWINEAKRLAENGAVPPREIREVVDDWMECKRQELDQIPQLMSGILKHMQSLSRESLLGGGELSKERVERLFKEFDVDDDGKIQLDELKNVVRKFKFGSLQLNVDEAAKKLMERIDRDNDNMIDKEEFFDAIKNFVCEARMVTPNSKDSELIDEYHRLTWEEAEALMTNKKQNKSLVKKLLSIDTIRASIQVVIGALIVIFLGRPLMMNVELLSRSMGIPSFFIAFVVIPLAINVRQLLSARITARQKMERTASLAFSEIYGAVVMNNILSLSIILAIIYLRGLTWDYSTEVLIVLVVGLLVGLLGFLHSTYQFWTCFIAISLYPLSLYLTYLLVYVLKWN